MMEGRGKIKENYFFQTCFKMKEKRNVLYKERLSYRMSVKPFVQDLSLTPA